jgi:exodeoxyribonuclease VII large subunit
MKGLDSGTEAKKSFTLSQLTESIKAQIDRIYSKPYWIKAEINRLNHYPQSGHCYPELVEKREGKIIAQIRGLIFRNTYARIESNFKNHTGKALSDGMEVMLLCRVKFDSKYGISVFVEDIDPAYTLGEMARARSLAIAKLKKEGIFELNQGLYLPKLLRHLAVISVATSKGWRDFTETIDDSLYSGLISRSLFPAKLQGDEAVESIGKALREIRSKAGQFDAVAIIRGGGGETGMDCYDSFTLAKQVATFPLPVLTGIGHSTNLTVVEMCSRKNLITPTALAGFIVNEFADFDNRIQTAARTLMRIGKHFLPLLENRLEGLAEKLDRTARQQIGSSEEELVRRASPDEHART